MGNRFRGEATIPFTNGGANKACGLDTFSCRQAGSSQLAPDHTPQDLQLTDRGAKLQLPFSVFSPWITLCVLLHP